MEDQDELIIRKSECEELGLEANNKAMLEELELSEIFLNGLDPDR